MSHRRRLTIFALTVVALCALGALDAPAGAQTRSSSEGPFIVLTGRIEVGPLETFEDAVIFRGPLTVDGTLTGSAIAFKGDVLVTGTVSGDVVAPNGRVTIAPGAHVGGDVVSAGEPSVAPGTVLGQVRRSRRLQLEDLGLAFAGRLVLWIIATVSTFLVGVVLILWLPRAAEATIETGLRRPWASLGWGALWFFALPAAGIILTVTIVAGLLGVGLLLGLILIYSVAYAAAACLLGRRLVRPPRGRFLAFLAGWGILRAIALVPILGGLVYTIAVMFGLGAIVLTAFRAARAAPASPAPSGSPPLPPIPSFSP